MQMSYHGIPEPIALYNPISCHGDDGKRSRSGSTRESSRSRVLLEGFRGQRKRICCSLTPSAGQLVGCIADGMVRAVSQLDHWEDNPARLQELQIHL